MDNVYGVDVSVWQGVMNWDIAKQKVQFAYIKASEGNKTVDSQFANNWAGSKGKVVRGMYHYYKPDKSWQEQADFFASLQKEDAELPPVIDIETDGGLLKSALEGSIVKFLGRFENLTKVQPILYTSAGFWNRYMPLTTWAKQYRLFVANYGVTKPAIPNDWLCNNCTQPYFTFWQYSADGNGQGKNYGAINTTEKDIDLDIYKGSVEMFNLEFGTKIEALESVIEDATFPEEAVVTVSKLFLRKQPTTAGVQLGYLLKGAEVIVQEEKIISPSETWVRVGNNLWCAKKYQNINYISYI